MQIINVLKFYKHDEEVFLREALAFCKKTGTTRISWFINCTPLARPLYAAIDDSLEKFKRCQALLAPVGIKAGFP